MSEICIGIMKHVPDGDTLSQMKFGAHKLSVDLDVELSWQAQYPEAFISEDILENGEVFELTKDGVAETLLCPNWCRFNDRDNEKTLEERIAAIQRIMSFFLEFVPSIDLYIGDSGGESEDYKPYDIRCSQMVDRLIALYEIDGMVPDVCLHIL